MKQSQDTRVLRFPQRHSGRQVVQRESPIRAICAAVAEVGELSRELVLNRPAALRNEGPAVNDTQQPDLFTIPRSRSRFVFDADAFGNKSRRDTFCDKVAALLKSRPGEWIDGREIMAVAGCYGWRTRVSELRRAPFGLNIENRQYRQGRSTVSEYRLVISSSEVAGARV